jgi:hypothetical protein
MGLTNVAGVFSRYFIVGFFLPSFFVLIVLAQIVDSAFLPTIYETAKPAGQAAIVGGAALLAGLVLLGLEYPILRLYEGYPLQKHGNHPPVRWLVAGLMRRQRGRLRRATEATETGEEGSRFTARWRRDLNFPHDDPNLLLPTSFGNALRAFERHSMTRWHLNSIGVWPHVEMLLTPQEAQVHADAKGDVAFFVNTSLVSVLAGIALIANAVWHGGDTSVYVEALICLSAVAVSAVAYLAAIGAAVQWGSAVRASIDLHRREVYEKLGLRQPTSFADERQIAYRLNALLLVGDRIPDEYAAQVADDSDSAPSFQFATPDGSVHPTNLTLSFERSTDPQGGMRDDRSD